MSGAAFILSDGGGFSAYRSAPSHLPAPGLILLHEIFGANATMRRIADAWATRGWLVLCPDLFWRQEPGVQLDDADLAARPRAMALLADFDDEAALADVAAATAALRADENCTGKVVVLGFCLGGRIAALAAAGGKVDAAVAYYPVGLAPHAERLQGGQIPLMIHLGADDPLNPPPAQAAIASALRGRIGARIEVHDAAGHAFARPGSEAFAEAAAVRADSSTVAFFALHSEA